MASAVLCQFFTMAGHGRSTHSTFLVVSVPQWPGKEDVLFFVVVMTLLLLLCFGSVGNSYWGQSFAYFFLSLFMQKTKKLNDKRKLPKSLIVVFLLYLYVFLRMKHHFYCLNFLFCFLNRITGSDMWPKNFVSA